MYKIIYRAPDARDTNSPPDVLHWEFKVTNEAAQRRAKRIAKRHNTLVEVQPVQVIPVGQPTFVTPGA